MSPIEISLIIFACVFGGAMLGMGLRSIIPARHLDADSKDVLKLAVGLIGTMAALLLGLLVASAKGSYDTRRAELTQMAANVIVLDRALAHYGPEANEIRGMLKIGVSRMVAQVWGAPGQPDLQPTAQREVLFDKIQELTPHSEPQRAIQSQVETMAINLGQTRWLLFEQGGSSISTPLLVVVVFWLSILFVGFGLFAPRNATVTVAMLVSAMSVAGAIFLIVELDRPFSGLIQISSAPLQNALAVLGK